MIPNGSPENEPLAITENKSLIMAAEFLVDRILNLNVVIQLTFWEIFTAV